MKKTIKVFLSIICILVIAFFTNGYLNGSFEYELELELDPPKEFCWAEYQYPSNLRHWIGGFKRIEMLDGGISEVGSKYKISFELKGSQEFFIQEIQKISHPEILECEIQNDKIIGEMAIRFSGETKTTLTY